MSLHPILRWPDQRLTQACDPADPRDPVTALLIEDLFETMYAARGRGLSAPQIGVMRRVFVVDAGWKDGRPTPLSFVNPVINHVSESELRQAAELCLSIPGVPMPVLRPTRVKVQSHYPGSAPAQALFDGSEARCIQHEADHLDGRVIFDHQPPDLRARFEADYAG